jgi:hypothetical protein
VQLKQASNQRSSITTSHLINISRRLPYKYNRMELPSETLAHRLNQRIAVAVFVADLSLWRFAEEWLLRRGFNPAARSGIRGPGARRE